MTAEITYNLNIDDFVELLEGREKLKGLWNKEYIVLKPIIVDDYLEVKVLYSDESHPKEWADYKEIEDNWDKRQKP